MMILMNRQAWSLFIRVDDSDVFGFITIFLYELKSAKQAKQVDGKTKNTEIPYFTSQSLHV